MGERFDKRAPKNRPNIVRVNAVSEDGGTDRTLDERTP